MSSSTDQTEHESPTAHADLAAGVDWYFQWLRQQMDLHREFTVTWTAAVTSLSSAVLGQWQAVEHIVAGHANLVAERAHGAELATRGLVEQVEVAAERTLDSLTDQQPPAPIPRQRAATREPSDARSADASAEQVRVTPDIFDDLIELVVDEDIKAAIP